MGNWGTKEKQQCSKDSFKVKRYKYFQILLLRVLLFSQEVMFDYEKKWSLSNNLSDLKHYMEDPNDAGIEVEAFENDKKSV